MDGPAAPSGAPSPDADRPADADRASTYLLVGGGLAILAGILTAIVAFLASSRLDRDTPVLAGAAAFNLAIGIAEVLLARRLRQPDGLAWRLAVGLTIVVIGLAGMDSLTLLSPGNVNSLWGSVGRLLVGLLAIRALWLSRAWHGLRS